MFLLTGGLSSDCSVWFVCCVFKEQGCYYALTVLFTHLVWKDFY